MATDPDTHGLPAPWRQRLQDLDLVLGVLIRAGVVCGAVVGFLAGLSAWLSLSLMEGVLIGFLLVNVLQLVDQRSRVRGECHSE